MLSVVWTEFFAAEKSAGNLTQSSSELTIVKIANWLVKIDKAKQINPFANPFERNWTIETKIMKVHRNHMRLIKTGCLQNVVYPNFLTQYFPVQFEKKKWILGVKYYVISENLCKP